MAKAKYDFGTRNTPITYYFADELVIQRISGKEVILTDITSEASIVVSGTKLQLGNGKLTGGTITEFEFFNASEESMLTVTGEFSAKVIGQAASKGIEKMMEKIFAGNDKINDTAGVENLLLGYGGKDTIKAGDGNDVLGGGKGNGDRLFGGSGRDVFLFNKGDGHDVIKDFDEGVPLASDYVTVNSSYQIRKNHDGDVVIWLNKNDTLTLEGVQRSDFEDYYVVLV